MDKRDLLTDLHALLKKHKVYLQTDNGDEINIYEENTDKLIQRFYYVIDAEDLDFRLSNMEK